VLLRAAVSCAAPVKHCLFSASGCPHCSAAQTDLRQLREPLPDLQIDSSDVRTKEADVESLPVLSRDVGAIAVSTPAVVVGEEGGFGFVPRVAAEVANAAP